MTTAQKRTLDSKNLRGLLLFAWVTALFAVRAYGSTNPPNILYIYTDDQSARTLSCYPEAYNYANTPNIDNLAAQGIRFDQAYIGAKCVPSRASFLAGRLQYDINDATNGQQRKYWLTALRANNYYTGMIGKWHWGDGAEEPAAHGHGTNWDWSAIWNHDAYAAAGGYYYDQYVMIDGAPQIPLGGYSTDRYTDYAEQFIREREADPDKPWFLWLCYAGVHGPYTPADRHIGIYENEPSTRVPVDIYSPRLGKPSHMQGGRWYEGSDGAPLFQRKPLDFWAKQYTEAVVSIDDGVGRIVQALQDTGQLDNTIIVFTSDQGLAWGQHGLKSKMHPYAAAIKSPLIVSNPMRFPTGKVCKAAVNGPDIVRTFHDITGTTPDQDLHGRDISPLLQNPDSEEVVAEWSETPTMMTYTYNRYTPEDITDAIQNQLWARLSYADKPGGNEAGPDAKPVWFMITDGDYNYIRYCYPGRMEELYDVKNDPEELFNLATQPGYATRLADMRKALVEELKAKGGASFADIMPTPTSEAWWPVLYPSDNAHVLYGSGTAQADGEALKTKNSWGTNGDSRIAYLRYDLSGDNEINGYPVDSILSVSLDLWMTQTEGDVENELQVFALVDGAQKTVSSLSETEWTGSTGANPLLDTNLPHGNDDPSNSALTTVMLGSHTFAAIGDNNELGLLQIQLSPADFRALIENDSNGEITLIVRSTSQGLSADFASMGNTNSRQAAPALTVTALPTPPTGLNAIAFNGRVSLNWDDSEEPNFAGYNVYRTAPGDPGNYSLLAANLSSSYYVDDDVDNGATYYYVVIAVDTNQNESALSNEVFATPQASGSSTTTLFGSNSDGLDGFATSAPNAAQEAWSTEADSVRYINDDPDGVPDSGVDGGTENASLLKAFPLDRSVGSSYTIEGVVTLTSGYADDNNRLAIYLFGDVDNLTSGGPEEDEAGALSLLYNFDNGALCLFEGIDLRQISATCSNTGRGGDNTIFGANNTVTFTVELSFLESGGTTEIEIMGSFRDEAGNTTSLTSTVPAADYPGDYFGFATRTRNRGVTGRNEPFIMDYRSFTVTDNSAPANQTPVFIADPFSTANATEGVAYSDTIAGSATDADGDSLTYSKVSGPAWLNVAADGTLSGTPTAADTGLNTWTVSVSDGIAPAVEATLNITVDSVNNAPTWSSYFGSNNDGLDGFTTSAPDAAQEAWSTEADSVRYINDDPDGTPDNNTYGDTKNSSLLKAFPLDRSVGSSYTIEGVVTLTSGYADDNNRLGIYLFGAVDNLTAGGPEEDEAGAISLLYNFDKGTLCLFEGIDLRLISATCSNTGRGEDNSIFGANNTVTFTVEIAFLESGGTGQIEITGSFRDEAGNTTSLTSTVPAADYPGDYFGFVTRARNRGVTSSDRNAPFTMDYKSFTITDTAPTKSSHFGSNNDGLDGFTTSAPDTAQEAWSTEADSVRYINDDPDGTPDNNTYGDTKNSSLLKAFALNRSVGSSYTIEGVVTLTDGYADDNNRLGIYLFGDVDNLTAGGPEEDEAGALSLLYNFDKGTLCLFEGIDLRLISTTCSNTGRGEDNSIFGANNTVTFTVEIAFLESGGTGQIEITGSFRDEAGNTTSLTSTVPAADYPGDYFGFATRARNRGVTSSDRNAPFTMDYKSFAVTNTSAN